MRSTRASRPRTTFRFRRPAIPSGSTTLRTDGAWHWHAPSLAVRIVLDVPAHPASLPPPAVMHEPELCLRGGGSIKRLPSHERVPRTLWFLAGGVGTPPTGKELREWKRRDREQVKAKTGKAKEKFWAAFVRALAGGRKMKDKGKKKEEGPKTEMTGMTSMTAPP